MFEWFGSRPPVDVAQRPALVNHALFMVFVAAFGAMVSFYLLLSVVALYATSAGAGGVGAGLTTGALMLSTVVAELAAPRLIARFGYRLVFGTGLLLLGAPALALIASANLAVILAVCLVRGVGFAIIVVAGSALVASLVPEARRGEGLGLYGVIVGVPAIVALPLGVWLVSRVGFPPVFIAGGLASLAGLAVIAALPGRKPQLEPALGFIAGLRRPALLRPAIVFATTAMAAGVVVTFLPLAVAPGQGDLAALGLLVHSAAATVARWVAGRYGDYHGQARLLLPSVVAAAIGMLALVLITNPVAVLAGMVLAGAGFGVAQNASLALMFDRVSPRGYDAVSALWNLTYDAGLGIGAAGFGVLAAQAGYAPAFAVTAGLMLVVLVPAWRNRAWLTPEETK